jgi:uncharacterized protein
MPDAAELFEAIDAGDVGRVSGLVSADPVLASARGEDGVSALLRARYRFDRPVMDALLAADPEMDVFDAAALGHADRLRHRLDEDPSRATAFASDGFTALHLAAFFGKTEAARILLAAGASVHTIGHNDLANQPLHAAVAGRHAEVCRLLLAAGADATVAERGGYSPLHQAAQHGDVPLVELFLSAGADPAARTDEGRDPGDVAEIAGHPDVAARLRAVVARSTPPDRP